MKKRGLFFSVLLVFVQLKYKCEVSSPGVYSHIHKMVMKIISSKNIHTVGPRLMRFRLMRSSH